MTSINRQRQQWLVLVLSVVAVALFPGGRAEGFEYLGNPTTKWDLGLNSASTFVATPPAGPGTPGAASWSAVPSGLGIYIAAQAFETHGGTSTDIEFLITPAVDGLEYALFSAAFEVWTEPARIDDLGQVTDSGVLVGNPEASGGHIGDIRVAGFPFDGVANTLAHAYQPGTETLFGAGGTIAGDIHFDTGETWLDDPADTNAVQDYDFYTIALHELGHALGLDHVAQASGSVMKPFYTGAQRSLTADDIAGIQAIYGARLQGDIDKDDDVDISGDILPAFSNFTGPNPGGLPTLGMRMAEGDADYDDDVDVSDILIMFGAFTGPLDEAGATGGGGPDGGGGLSSPAEAADPNIPDLVYNAATGEVILDPDGSGIIGYSLKNTTNSFLAGNHTPILGGVTTSLSSELAEAALSSPGSAQSIGLVFPAGLDLAGLTALLSTNEVSRSLGAPIVPFDLVVLGAAVPEPTTAALAIFGLLSLLFLARHRNHC